MHQPNSLDVAKHKQLLLDEIDYCYKYITEQKSKEAEVTMAMWAKYCDLLRTYEMLEYKN